MKTPRDRDGTRVGPMAEIVAAIGAASLAMFALLHPVLLGNRLGGHTRGFRWLAGEREMEGLFDVEVVLLPFLAHAAGELRAGRIPLWNPWAGTGAPFLANQQSAVMHPFTWVAVASPLADRLLAVAILRIVLASAGSYWLARLTGARAMGAAVAAVTFATGGSMAAWICYPLGSVLAHLPLAAAIGIHLGRNPRTSVSPLALVLGSTILAGHLEYLPLIWAVTALVAVASARRRAHGIARLAGGALLGVFLGGAMLVPAIEYLQLSAGFDARRGGHATAGALCRLPSLVDPRLFAPRAPGALRSAALSPAVRDLTRRPQDMASTYVGGAVVVLAAAAATSAPRLALLAAAAILMWLPGPLSAPLWSMAPFRFMEPDRFSALHSLLLALLAGRGVELVAEARASRAGALAGLLASAALVAAEPALLPGLPGTSDPRRACALLGASTAAMLVLASRRDRPGPWWRAPLLLGIVLLEHAQGLAGANRWERPDRLFPEMPALDRLRELQGADRVVGAGSILLPNLAMAYHVRDARLYDALGIRSVEEAFAGEGARSALGLRSAVPSPMTRLAACRLLLLPRKPGPRPGIATAAGSFEIAPIAAASSLAQPVVARRGWLCSIWLNVAPARAPWPTAVVVEVRRDGGAGAAASVARVRRRWLKGGEPLRIDLDPEIWTDEGECLAVVVTPEGTGDDGSSISLLGGPAAGLPATLDGVEAPFAVAGRLEWGEPRLVEEPSVDLPGIRAMHDPRALPRVRIPDREPGAARLVRDEPQRLDIEVVPGAPGTLVVADAHYPGWEAHAEGNPVALERSGPFRALRLPAGIRSVRLDYRPFSFRIGLFVTLAGVAWLAVSLAARRSLPRGLLPG